MVSSNLDALGERVYPDYASRLDASIVFSICRDYDDGSEAEARAVLDQLAASASTSQLELPVDMSEDTQSSMGTGTTDDELAERAFQEWALDEIGASDTLQDDSQSLADASDPVSLLQNLFPKRQRIELDLVLYEDNQGDIERAVEDLLTQDLLLWEEEQEHAAWLAEVQDQEGGQTGKKQRQKAKKTGKQTVSLTSTPRGLRTPNLASLDDNHFKPQTENVWAKGESTSLYLATLLSVSPGQLQSLFYQNNNSMPLAICKILDEAEPLWPAIDDAEAKLLELKQLFPDQPMSTLRRCLCGTQGDSTKAIELFKTLQDLHAKEGTPLAHKLLLDTRADRGQAKSALVAPPAASNATLTAGKTSSQATNVIANRPPSAVDCLTLATTIRGQRDDAYRSAARTFQAKHALGSSGVAAYWADHARQLDRQAREWELRAARATVEDRQKNARSLQSIDLHGLNVAQALTITKECLVRWWSAPMAPASLSIITGAGKHSAGQAPILLPAVKKLLDREGYNWKYEGDDRHRGAFLVYGLQGRRKGRTF